jgi:SAM-dependent methyltransferase
MPSPLEIYGPISPPFDFNSRDVSKFSPEVTGRLLLKSLCARLGWPSLAEKRLLDFGCGVRFARTIFNLEMEIGLYFGIDTNAAPIAWLKENLQDRRFRFEHLDMRNAMYNPNGRCCDAAALSDMGIGEFDAACMFSVITHQEPADAELVFVMLRPCSSRLYFTALIDDQVAGYAEGDSQQPLNLSTYTTAHIMDLLAKTGWRVDAVHPPRQFQVTAFVCTRS